MGGQRFFALDVLRVVLTCAICVLHAISAFSFHQSNDEASALLGTDLPNNGARLSALRSISSIGFTLVDLFFALTSIMITDKLLRTWSAPAPPTWSDLVSTYYGRMVGTCLPLFIVMGLYVIGFRDGIYPEATNRAENALVLHRMSSNHSVELLEGKVTPGGVLTTLKDPGLHGWPYLLLHISNIGVPVSEQSAVLLHGHWLVQCSGRNRVRCAILSMCRAACWSTAGRCPSRCSGTSGRRCCRTRSTLAGGSLERSAARAAAPAPAVTPRCAWSSRPRCCCGRVVSASSLAPSSVSSPTAI